MKDYPTIIMFILIIAIMVAGCYFDRKHDDSAWNDGYCAICGDKWEYQDMYHIHNSGNRYIYCDKNGHTIDISKNYGK